MPGTLTRTWSLATSPRNPYKLQSLLELLLQVEGQPWNRTTQAEFAALLAASEDYEGEVPGNLDFAARDRVSRAPQKLGLVRLKRGQPLLVTAAGRALLDSGNQEDVLLHQLLKWQYPSPVHSKAVYRNLFRVRPFLETLRLAWEAEGLSKEEVAFFAIPLIDYRHFDQTITLLRDFRDQLHLIPRRVDRERFKRGYFRERLQQIYADDIAAGRIGTREAKGAPPSLDRLLGTRRRTLLDYADAAIRYFFATGLFTLASHARRLSIRPDRTSEVAAILETVPREPHEFGDLDAFREVFEDPVLPALPSDDVLSLRQQLVEIAEQLPEMDANGLGLVRRDILQLTSTTQLKGLLVAARHQLSIRAELALAAQLRSMETTRIVVEAYSPEALRDALVPALHMEWNTWRVFAMLNDGEINPNLRMDQHGEPVALAPGNVPDIVCEYSQFHLGVEVTLTKGATQYNSEHEPVSRHIGRMQKRSMNAGDRRPVYGLFIAHPVNRDVYTYFWGLHKINSASTAGPVRVIPLNLRQFTRMLDRISGKTPINSALLFRFCEQAALAALRSATEEQWIQLLESASDRWPE